MKKRITFVVLIMAMVLCLALTCCGQKTDKQEATTTNDRPGENFDTGDSSIMDGTNNPGGIIQSDDDSYADDAAKDREDTSNTNEGSDTGANRNADGTYSWQVGGSTITTKINVMDYIDGNVWHVNDMATALGWDKNKRADSPKPMTFQPDDTYDVYINFSDGSDHDHCGFIFIKGNDRRPITVFLPPRASGDYTFNTKDYTMSLEGIVIFAYTCEYLTDNPSGNPYDGVLSSSGGWYGY